MGWTKKWSCASRGSISLWLGEHLRLRTASGGGPYTSKEWHWAAGGTRKPHLEEFVVVLDCFHGCEFVIELYTVLAESREDGPACRGG
jgi:hypothetical protein